LTLLEVVDWGLDQATEGALDPLMLVPHAFDLLGGVSKLVFGVTRSIGIWGRPAVVSVAWGHDSGSANDVGLNGVVLGKDVLVNNQVRKPNSEKEDHLSIINIGPASCVRPPGWSPGFPALFQSAMSGFAARLPRKAQCVARGN
jgi:hypothetical protein